MVLLAVIPIIALVDMLIVVIISVSLSRDSYVRFGGHVYHHDYQWFS